VQIRKPALGFILMTLLLDVLGFGLLIPVGPRLIQSLLPGGATESEAAPYVGFLQATFAAMSFLFAPFLGVLSDRVGRRPVILISLFGAGLDYFAMALSQTVSIFFITRVINGITGASFSAVNAYVADVTPPEKRAAGFGMIGAAFGLGFVVGPLLGGVLGDIDIRLPFYVAGGLTLLNWVYGYFVLPESLPPQRRAPLRLSRANPVGAFANLTRYPVVLALAISYFLLNMAQFGLHVTWVLSMQHRFGWTPWDTGMSLAMVGVGAVIVQGFLTKAVVPALGEKRSLMIGLAIGVLSYVGYGAANHGWMIYAVIAIGSLGAISQPAVQSIITKTVHRDEQGAIQGALASVNSLAGILGPIVAAATLAYFIRVPPPFPESPINLAGANFYLSAVLAGLGWLVAGWAIRHLPDERIINSTIADAQRTDEESPPTS
jgi:MFS transporter, DHA1 family, tetracycline resistance protein